MIEQAMVFLLGFFVAGLLALAAVPALWRRAERLTRRRLELIMPLSPREVAADRDALRAELAVRLRAMEQAVDQSVADRAQAQAALGQETVAREELGAALASLSADHAQRGEQIEALRRDLTAAGEDKARLQAELEAAQALGRERAQMLVEQGRELAALDRLADERKASLAAAEARIAALDARLASAPSEADQAAEVTALRLKVDAGAHALADARAELADVRAAGVTLPTDAASLDDPRLRTALQTLGTVVARLAEECERQPDRVLAVTSV